MSSFPFPSSQPRLLTHFLTYLLFSLHCSSHTQNYMVPKYPKVASVFLTAISNRVFLSFYFDLSFLKMFSSLSSEDCILLLLLFTPLSQPSSRTIPRPFSNIGLILALHSLERQYCEVWISCMNFVHRASSITIRSINVYASGML